LPDFLTPPSREPRLRGRGDVFATIVLKNGLGAAGFVGRIGVDGDQDVAFAKFVFITLGFVFGHAHAD
jgi:hypothetical protein